MHLDGSTALSKFKSGIADIEKGREIIFYWAWHAEASAAGLAAEYQTDGFQNTKVLSGGVAAWKNAGYPVL